MATADLMIPVSAGSAGLWCRERPQAQHPRGGEQHQSVPPRDASCSGSSCLRLLLPSSGNRGRISKIFSSFILLSTPNRDSTWSRNTQGAPGVLPARKFVWWYNGHPHSGDVNVDLSAVRSVAVLGLGNVALDCARLLLAPPERLAPTDVAERALQQLRRSAVQDVHLIARRSPVEVHKHSADSRTELRCCTSPCRDAIACNRVYRSFADCLVAFVRRPPARRRSCGRSWGWPARTCTSTPASGRQPARASA